MIQEQLTQALSLPANPTHAGAQTSNFNSNSIDLQKGIDFLEADDLPGMAGFLLEEIQKLARAGADFGIIAANTPHIVFDEVKANSPIPFISIVEAAAEHVTSRGLRRLALFGTRYTMEADFYPKVFQRAGIELMVPGAKDRDYIHEKYFAELVPGIFLPETRAALLTIIDGMKTSDGIEGVLLAGTELALILRGKNHNEVALLDTGKIHPQAAVSEMLK